MAEQEQQQAGAAVFGGAAVAAGYIELDHTLTPEAVAEARRAASLDELPAEDPRRPVRPTRAADNDDLGIPPAPLTRPPAPRPEPIVIRTVDDLGIPIASEPRASDVFNSTPDDLALLAANEPERSQIATKGIRGVLSKLGIKVAPGTAEKAELDRVDQNRRNEEIVRQATWTRAVSVLVANRKGGVGKTPVSVLLGGTLAAIRGGSVAIMEVSDDPGALAFRAEGNPGRGMGELVRDIAHITNAGQLAGYTAPQTSFASVIGSVSTRPSLTYEDVVAVASLVDEFYSIRVMDSGNQLTSSAFRGAIETADVLVVPVFLAGDAVLDALALLDELRRQGGRAAQLANNAVMLRLRDGRPEHPQVVERVQRLINGARAGQVLDIGYDEHIAERGQLTLDKLTPDTRSDFIEAAAAVVKALRVGVTD